jgi:hypothetical protein
MTKLAPTVTNKAFDESLSPNAPTSSTTGLGIAAGVVSGVGLGLFIGGLVAHIVPLIAVGAVFAFAIPVVIGLLLLFLWRWGSAPVDAAKRDSTHAEPMLARAEPKSKLPVVAENRATIHALQKPVIA